MEECLRIGVRRNYRFQLAIVIQISRSHNRKDSGENGDFPCQRRAVICKQDQRKGGGGKILHRDDLFTAVAIYVADKNGISIQASIGGILKCELNGEIGIELRTVRLPCRDISQLMVVIDAVTENLPIVIAGEVFHHRLASHIPNIRIRRQNVQGAVFINHLKVTEIDDRRLLAVATQKIRDAGLHETSGPRLRGLLHRPVYRKTPKLTGTCKRPLWTFQ